ncbi:hypothetical protein [Alkalitalea saponilacus]|nr:hypothetical protein [Alkalitalea saponilacus]
MSMKGREWKGETEDRRPETGDRKLREGLRKVRLDVVDGLMVWSLL